MVVSLFMSHTKLDEDFCDKFDRVAAREGVRVFRSEFEEIKSPAWLTIKEEMEQSSAMFLLVGKWLVRSQELSDASKEYKERWKFTQNWISYEVGLACQLGIDVWVICDHIKINFPVPYLNNYEIFGPRSLKNMKWYRSIFKHYNNGGRFQLGFDNKYTLSCPHFNCKSFFNFHSKIRKKSEVVCPTCLRKMIMEEGWLLEP